MTESVNEAAIENVAAYASSPFRISRNQWKAAEAPEPLSNAANLVLQALRGTGQYMGIYAIVQTVGTGTPGEIRRAIKELEDRGLLEAAPEEPKDRQPGKAQEKPQEPAQEPSAPEPAPAPTEPEPTAEEPAGSLTAEQLDAILPQEPAVPFLVEDTKPLPPFWSEEEAAAETDIASDPDVIRNYVVEKLEEAPSGYPDVPHDLRLGDGPIYGQYPTLQAAVTRAEDYILSKDYPWLYVALVRVSDTDGPWIRVRDPREPSSNESAQASR